MEFSTVFENNPQIHWFNTCIIALHAWAFHCGSHKAKADDHCIALLTG